MGTVSLLQGRALPAGTRLNSVYEIESVLAVGGMGIVYRGRLVETRDPVAIKMIGSAFADSPDAQALLRREALALKQLRHDAIVRYFVFAFEPELKRHYLVMELVEGTPLSDVIRQGPLAPGDVDILRKRIALGLHAAHEAGIVHRDVSPDNVILPDGDVSRSKIIDFGIARASSHGTTIIGQGFAGKQNYVSPEGAGLFGEVTPRSDIYSLGLVLAACLRGRPVDMGGAHVDVVAKRERPPDLGDLSSPLRPLLEAMLQPNPRDRPPTMRDVAAWEPKPAEAQPSLALRRPLPWRVPAAVAAALLLAVGLAAAVGGWLLPGGPADPPPAALADGAGSRTAPAASVALLPDLPNAPPAPASPSRPAPEPDPAPPLLPVQAAPAVGPPEPPTPLLTAAIPAAPAPVPVPPTPADGETRSELVRLAQIELIRLGCYAGPADATLGPATREAFEAFARANSLAWSGDVAEGAVAWLKGTDTGCRNAATSGPPPAPAAAVQAGRGQVSAASCRELSEKAQLGPLTVAEGEALRRACR